MFFLQYGTGSLKNSRLHQTVQMLWLILVIAIFLTRYVYNKNFYHGDYANFYGNDYLVCLLPNIASLFKSSCIQFFEHGLTENTYFQDSVD